MLTINRKQSITEGMLLYTSLHRGKSDTLDLRQNEDCGGGAALTAYANSGCTSGGWHANHQELRSPRSLVFTVLEKVIIVILTYRIVHCGKLISRALAVCSPVPLWRSVSCQTRRADLSSVQQACRGLAWKIAALKAIFTATQVEEGLLFLLDKGSSGLARVPSDPLPSTFDVSGNPNLPGTISICENS